MENSDLELLGLNHYEIMLLASLKKRLSKAETQTDKMDLIRDIRFIGVALKLIENI